ncbi:MAG: hypothetical protein Pars92KO_29520 [Parasphingorhabdus sp.]
MSMFLKTMIFHIFIGSTLMGTAVTALLVMDHASKMSILVAALTAFAVAGPVSWLIARRLH